jgi:hypothetical protein
MIKKSIRMKILVDELEWMQEERTWSTHALPLHLYQAHESKRLLF